MTDETFTDGPVEAEASAAPQDSADPYGEAPQSWERDIASRHWSGLDAELRGYISTRDRQSHEAISRLGNDLKSAREAAERYSAFDGLFERWSSDMPEGMERAEAVEQLLAGNRFMNESPIDALGMLLQQYGVDPVALLPEAMRQQIAELHGQAHKARVAEVEKVLDDFKRDKPYYAEIRDGVIAEIQAIRKGAPGLDNLSVLKLAHDRVLESSGMGKRLEQEREAKRAADDFARVEEARKREAQDHARRVKEAKKAAGINVKSSPGQAVSVRTLDDDLREIARRHYS